MRMVWFSFLVTAVCLPMALVSVLVVEAYWPKLDGLTAAMPSGVRTTVAEMAMNHVGFGKDSGPKLQRVLQLDPENAEAVSQSCQALAEAEDQHALTMCKKAIGRVASAANYSALGQAQDEVDDFCAAEESYTVANNFAHGGNGFYLREMGIAAYQCGRVAYSVAELGAAESLDEKDAADPNQDEDDLADAKQGLQTDREWLGLAYAAEKMPRQAAESWGKAHADWKSCSCRFADGKPVCTASAGADASGK